MYAARVSIEQVEFVAAAVQDERQLDGAWHLELLAESEEASMALRLMLDREGTVEEGELILTRENADELGAIEPGATADELDPLELELAAELGGARGGADARSARRRRFRLAARARSRTVSAVAVLAGGVGAARFLDGLVQVVAPQDVTAIVNVGDDMEWAGLHIAPDLDTVMYTLSGLVNPEMGWGVANDGRRVLDRLKSLGGPAWFTIGDDDLATHLYRTQRLREGAPLSTITAELCERVGIECRVTPVTDDRLRTVVQTPEGELAFQDYFVRRRAADPVHALRFDGAGNRPPRSRPDRSRRAGRVRS